MERANGCDRVGLISSDSRVTSDRAQDSGLAAMASTVWRSPLRPEAMWLLGIALLVQVVFPYRHDWPAHLVAGGGVVLVVAALLPSRLAPAAGVLGYVVVLALGWISEHSFLGPPDWMDVVFTVAGALITYQAASEIARGNWPRRREAVAWGLVLIVLALAYRYSNAFGPV